MKFGQMCCLPYQNCDGKLKLKMYYEITNINLFPHSPKPPTAQRINLNVYSNLNALPFASLF